MKKTILITGGIRSGKSRYAVELAKKQKGKTAFIATAMACDLEMKERITKHQASRPRHWHLLEENKDLLKALTKLKAGYNTVLIDCLGLFISNLLLDKLSNEAIEKRIKKLADTIPKLKLTTIIVSNEVGYGLVPDNKLGRRFCDLLGFANQALAKVADQVMLMVSGIPIEIKSIQKTKPVKATEGKKSTWIKYKQR